MSLTGAPFIVLVILLSVALPVALVVFWTRISHPILGPAARLAGVLLCQVLAIGAVFVVANRVYGFYNSWGDLFGTGGDQVSQVTVNQLVPQNGTQGKVVILHVRGRTSGARGDVLVWLPPEYFQPQYAKTLFPVMMWLPGQPGTPEGAFYQFDFGNQATLAISSHRLQPFVGVFPPIMIDPPRDTECTNVPRGPQAESWLSIDVREAVLRKFRVTPAHWGTAGFSTGGFCASKLLLRHPAIFAAAANVGGYFTAETDRGTGKLFAGSKQLRLENSPSWLITRLGPTKVTNLLIVVSVQDRRAWKGVHYADAARMIQITKGYPGVSTIIMPTGGHNFRVYRAQMPAILDWFGRAMRL